MVNGNRTALCLQFVLSQASGLYVTDCVCMHDIPQHGACMCCWRWPSLPFPCTALYGILLLQSAALTA